MYYVAFQKLVQIMKLKENQEKKLHIPVLNPHLKASAHSFKQFTSRLLKSTFSLSLCTYITRMDVMLDFICMGPVDLPGARRKRQNTKWSRQRKAWHPLAGGQSWPWSMTLWPKINRVPPLIMVNVHVKFESDWAKTEVAIVSTRSKLTLTFDPMTQNQLGSSSHHGECACEVWKWLGKNWSRYCVHKVLYTECQSWPWPLTPWPKINRVPPLIINNLHVKFESDWAKTVVCIVSTRSYTQSAKVDLDLWPRDPKSIGFLLSSW